jgi:hypothetical protein
MNEVGFKTKDPELQYAILHQEQSNLVMDWPSFAGILDRLNEQSTRDDLPDAIIA